MESSGSATVRRPCSSRHRPASPGSRMPLRRLRPLSNRLSPTAHHSAAVVNSCMLNDQNLAKAAIKKLNQSRSHASLCTTEKVNKNAIAESVGNVAASKVSWKDVLLGPQGRAEKQERKECVGCGPAQCDSC